MSGQKPGSSYETAIRSDGDNVTRLWAKGSRLRLEHPSSGLYVDLTPETRLQLISRLADGLSAEQRAGLAREWLGISDDELEALDADVDYWKDDENDTLAIESLRRKLKGHERIGP